jgi:hypothetical protein
MHILALIIGPMSFWAVTNNLGFVARMQSNEIREEQSHQPQITPSAQPTVAQASYSQQKK